MMRNEDRVPAVPASHIDDGWMRWVWVLNVIVYCVCITDIMGDLWPVEVVSFLIWTNCVVEVSV